MEDVCNKQNLYENSDTYVSEQQMRDKPKVSKWAKFLTNDSDEENWPDKGTKDNIKLVIENLVILKQ